MVVFDEDKAQKKTKDGREGASPSSSHKGSHTSFFFLNRIAMTLESHME